jgi:hypothetical protein
VGFVVGKVELGQVFSEYFGFPCQSSFHQLLHNHNRPVSGHSTQSPTAQIKKKAEDTEVGMEVRNWLRQQSKDFYAAGFDTLVERWDKHINVGGGYFEK